MVRYETGLQGHQWDGAAGWFQGWTPPRLVKLAVAFMAQGDVRLFAVDEASQEVVGVAAGYLGEGGRMRIALLEVRPDRPRGPIDAGLRARIARHPAAREIVDLGRRVTQRPPPPAHDAPSPGGSGSNR